MVKDRGSPYKIALQLVAILCLIALFSMVLHKATVDLSALAQQHSGIDFWAALARHILRNLAGS
jgi:hypothetical protein